MITVSMACYRESSPTARIVGTRVAGRRTTVMAPREPGADDAVDGGAPIPEPAYLRPTAGDPVPWWRTLFRLARRAAEACGGCGRVFGPVEAIWLGRLGRGRFRRRVPTCAGCAPAARWLPPRHCRRCGRMIRLPVERGRRPRPFCCCRCKDRWYRRRAARGVVRTGRCLGCGAGFVPARRDARTCSPGCRQALYRRRHAARTKR